VKIAMTTVTVRPVAIKIDPEVEERF